MSLNLAALSRRGSGCDLENLATELVADERHVDARSAEMGLLSAAHGGKKMEET
jgi:hypothetical protein